MLAIKGMEMPKNCAECPMYNSDVDDYCDITGEWITGEEMRRHKDCPLVEIVTCKDCTNHVTGALDEEICLKGHELIHENFFCKDGERRK